MANTTCARCGNTVIHDTTKIPTADTGVTDVKVYCIPCGKLVLTLAPPKRLTVIAPMLNQNS